VNSLRQMLKNSLKPIFDPRARLEASRIARLKREEAAAEEIERRRPDIHAEIAAMDAAEVKRLNDEDRDRVDLWKGVLKVRDSPGATVLGTPEQLRRHVDEMEIAEVRRQLSELRELKRIDKEAKEQQNALRAQAGAAASQKRRKQKRPTNAFIKGLSKKPRKSGSRSSKKGGGWQY